MLLVMGELLCANQSALQPGWLLTLTCNLWVSYCALFLQSHLARLGIDTQRVSVPYGPTNFPSTSITLQTD